MPNRVPRWPAWLGGACSLLILVPQAGAQQRQATQPPQQERAAAAETLRLPPEQAIVVVTVQAPGEVRVGRSFDYQIRVENVSQNMAVHDLVIAQHADEGFEIESSEVLGKEGQGQSSRAPNQQTGQEGRRRAPQQDQRSDEKAQDEQQGQQKRQADKEGEQSAKPQRDESARDEEPEQKESQREESQDDASASEEAQRDSSQDRDSSKDDDEQQESDQSRRSAAAGQSDQSSGSRWKIDRLMPGESRTIHVTATSDSEGTGNVCVAIESYVPAVCLATRFTRPELDIEKKAPETANICDEIQFEYLVKNTGTGDLQRFTVRDELPEGLQTIDGAKKLEFTLEDGLKAGETRKFVARLRATQTGDFTSRAVVEGSEGVEARSNRAGTLVQKADLAVAIDGPQAQEVGGLANYTVRVTNRGDAPAPGTQLRIYFPRSADLVRSGEPRKSSGEVSQRSAANRRSEDERGEHDHRSQAEASSEENRADDEEQSQSKREEQQEQDQKSSDEDSRRSDQPGQATSENEEGQARDRSDEARREQARENLERQQMAQAHWQLGTLAPGETVELAYVLRPYEGGDLEQVAVAEYVCATAQDRELLRAETKLATEILMLPGLRVTVIDDHDPVPVGQNVVYTVTVLNQGNAPAHAVEINAKLPKELTYVESSGATTGEASENEIEFKPVEKLEPGQKAVWQIVAKVKEGVGERTQSSIDIELNSDDLDETITSQEPTTLFEGEKRTARSTDEEESEKK